MSISSTSREIIEIALINHRCSILRDRNLVIDSILGTVPSELYNNVCRIYDDKLHDIDNAIKEVNNSYVGQFLKEEKSS